jgi:hypothetical protein
MKRRVFVASALAGTGLAVGRSAQATVKPGDNPMRVFGKTGVKLTVVGLAGGRFPPCTREDAREITRRAYELGVTYYDTTTGYWNGASEEVHGEVLPQWRKADVSGWLALDLRPARPICFHKSWATPFRTWMPRN